MDYKEKVDNPLDLLGIALASCVNDVEGPCW
jgi:hypothetical protein